MRSNEEMLRTTARSDWPLVPVTIFGRRDNSRLNRYE